MGYFEKAVKLMSMQSTEQGFRVCVEEDVKKMEWKM